MRNCPGRSDVEFITAPWVTATTGKCNWECLTRILLVTRWREDHDESGQTFDSESRKWNGKVKSHETEFGDRNRNRNRKGSRTCQWQIDKDSLEFSEVITQDHWEGTIKLHRLLFPHIPQRRSEGDSLHGQFSVDKLQSSVRNIQDLFNWAWSFIPFRSLSTTTT